MTDSTGIGSQILFLEKQLLYERSIVYLAILTCVVVKD